MDSKNVQELLAAAGYYKSVVDGVWGDKTHAAARAVVDKHLNELHNYGQWTRNRIIVAGAQLVLKYAGFDVGLIDGLMGHNTNEAFLDWLSVKATGSPREIDRTPVQPAPTVRSYFPTQSGCVSFYGSPGLPGSAAEAAMQKKLVYVGFPFPFRIDWDLSSHVTRMRLHEKCAASAEEAYKRVYKEYGKYRMETLGLDRFAGSYMARLMRGSTKTFSMHAYGCAIDTYAAPNGLNTHKPQALFSKSDYNTWFDIWQDLGWTPLGRAIDRDYMHIQAASL